MRICPVGFTGFLCVRFLPFLFFLPLVCYDSVSGWCLISIGGRLPHEYLCCRPVLDNTCGRGIRVGGSDILEGISGDSEFDDKLLPIRGPGPWLAGAASVLVGMVAVNEVCSAFVSDCDLHIDMGTYGHGSLISGCTHTNSGGCWGLSCRNVTSDRI